VYLIQWENPRLIIDVTDTIDLKVEAIRCHASQVADFKAFEDRMRARAATLGRDKGYAYAEGFDHIVVSG
jgi:LmbE family N-acetylglucosaminyl deacetylase